LKNMSPGCDHDTLCIFKDKKEPIRIVPNGTKNSFSFSRQRTNERLTKHLWLFSHSALYMDIQSIEDTNERLTKHLRLFSHSALYMDIQSIARGQFPGNVLAS
jgi:hypothetical protein